MPENPPGEKEPIKEEPANPDLSRVSEESFLEDNEGAGDEECESDAPDDLEMEDNDDISGDEKKKKEDCKNEQKAPTNNKARPSLRKVEEEPVVLEKKPAVPRAPWRQKKFEKE